MSNPTVMKTINNKSAMGKKQAPALATASKSPPNKQVEKGAKVQAPAPAIVTTSPELLKHRRKEMELRLAYEQEESSQTALKQMVNLHQQKKDLNTSKISKIVENQEEKLARRIRERRLKSEAKSMSSHLTTEMDEKDYPWKDINHKGDQQTRKYSVIEEINRKGRRAYRSVSPKKQQVVVVKSPMRRSISYNMALHVNHEHIKLWNLTEPVP
jgi:hypothetical protein